MGRLNKIINLITLLLVLFLLFTGTIQAQMFHEVAYPCSVVLYPVDHKENALGTALIAKVKKPYTDSPTSNVRTRESIGIYADWLPLPSSFEDYDQYEGFGQIPGVISWRFKMY